MKIQAGRNWNQTLNECLKNIGLKQSKIDPCLYTLKEMDKFIALAIYVDDIFSIDNDPELRNSIIKKINENSNLQTLEKQNGS